MGGNIKFAFLALLLCAASCGRSASEEEDQHIAEGSSSILDPKGEFDEDSARADAVADVSDMTFEDVGDTSSCTDDCSGHSAGFEWAKENTEGDASLCSGDSDSFVEGCQAFAQAVDERVEQMRSEWANGET